MSTNPENRYVDIVVDAPPGPNGHGRFIEVEDERGHSIEFGTWVKREDGAWVLRIPPRQPCRLPATCYRSC